MTVADKLIPSFYVIELEGKAVQSIIPGDFGIEKIAIGSRDFTNDMFATAALADAMQFIVLNPDLDKSVAEERIDYNPEFFPSLQSSTASKIEEEEITEATEALGIAGQIAVPITRHFDPLGDFVQSRWIVQSKDFKVYGKVAVNPDKYMHHKVMEAQARAEPPQMRPKAQRIALH